MLYPTELRAQPAEGRRFLRLSESLAATSACHSVYRMHTEMGGFRVWLNKPPKPMFPAVCIRIYYARLRIKGKLIWTRSSRSAADAGKPSAEDEVRPEMTRLRPRRKGSISEARFTEEDEAPVDLLPP